MFDLTHFALSADYLDGAKFHMFKAADYDEAASYARRKGWAVAGYEPSDIGAHVISVVPPLRADEDERRLVYAALDRNPDVVIHPVGQAPSDRWR